MRKEFFVSAIGFTPGIATKIFKMIADTHVKFDAFERPFPTATFKMPGDFAAVVRDSVAKDKTLALLVPDGADAAKNTHFFIVRRGPAHL